MKLWRREMILYFIMLDIFFVYMLIPIYKGSHNEIIFRVLFILAVSLKVLINYLLMFFLWSPVRREDDGEAVWRDMKSGKADLERAVKYYDSEEYKKNHPNTGLFEWSLLFIGVYLIQILGLFTDIISQRIMVGSFLLCTVSFFLIRTICKCHDTEGMEKQIKKDCKTMAGLGCLLPFTDIMFLMAINTNFYFSLINLLLSFLTVFLMFVQLFSETQEIIGKTYAFKKEIAMLLVLYGLMFTELMVIYQFGMKMFNSQITLLKFCFGVIDFLAVAGFLTVLFRHLPKWTDEGYIG